MPLDAPTDEDVAPPHDGEPIPQPTTYREARIALGRTYATNGYALHRRHLDAWTRGALEERERPILAASEPLEARDKFLTDEHRKAMQEIFELMQVPGTPQTGLRDRVRSHAD